MSNSSPSHRKPSIRTEPGDTESITSSVVTAVAEASGKEPTTPLYEAINPDALEALYRHGSPEVSFEYTGCHVTIHSDRTITVSALDTESHL